MTLLEEYLSLRESFRKQIAEEKFSVKNILLLQELNYRIGIIETFQNFCQTASATSDMNAISYHHQLVLAFIGKIVTERQLGEKPNAETAKRRETASDALSRVVSDCSARFAAFKPETDQQYKKALSAFVNTILPVWVQYRTSFVDIKTALGGEGARPKPQEEDPMEIQFRKALAVPCPINKYAGKTLGDLLTLDPNALNWLATKFEDETVRAAAKYICEYAVSKCA